MIVSSATDSNRLPGYQQTRIPRLSRQVGLPRLALSLESTLRANAISLTLRQRIERLKQRIEAHTAARRPRVQLVGEGEGGGTTMETSDGWSHVGPADDRLHPLCLGIPLVLCRLPPGLPLLQPRVPFLRWTETDKLLNPSSLDSEADARQGHPRAAASRCTWSTRTTRPSTRR